MGYAAEDLKTVIKQAVFDERLDSYRSFYNGKWAERIGQLVHRTSLDRPFFDLCIAWKATSTTFHWPLLAVDSVTAFWDGVRGAQDETLPLMLTVCRQLVATALGDSITPEQSVKLDAACDHLVANAGPQIATLRHPSPRTELWAGWVADTEFQLALWSTQRLCFAGLVFAYEAFLTHACQVKTGGRCKDVGKALGPAFGPNVLRHCWADPEIEYARRVRTCLAHNGGRPTAEVCAAPGRIRIEGDELQVMAPDVTSLYGVLRQKVEWFVHETHRVHFSL